jgi:hypothetical protein
MAAVQVQSLQTYLAPGKGGAGMGVLADTVDRLPAASNIESNTNMWIVFFIFIFLLRNWHCSKRAFDNNDFGPRVSFTK